MNAEIIRIIVEALVGSTFLVTLFTLRATKKKAIEEARKCAIDNDKELVVNFHKLIVEPLKKEVYALRRDVRQFTRAVAKINDCPAAGNCPVRNELQNPRKEEEEINDN